MNVAIDIHIRIIAKTTDSEFWAVCCKSSLSRDGAMYPHSNPNANAMVRQIEPTIAKPTLTGIFLKAPKTKEMTEDTVLASQDSNDDAACLIQHPLSYRRSRCGDA